MKNLIILFFILCSFTFSQNRNSITPNIPRDNNNMILANPSFELMVSIRNFKGLSPVDKFGVNLTITPATDPEDIWEVGGMYNYDTFGTAPIISIISNDNSDTQPISILGLDIEGNEVSQLVNLNGTTRVELDIPLWRIYRMENQGGEGEDLAGTVRAYIGTGGFPSVDDTRAQIDNGNNQTLMALITIPKGKVGFLYRGEVGLQFEGGIFSGNEYARLSYQSRRFEKVFKIKKVISLVAEASSIFQDYRSFPDIIPALTDIKITCLEVSATLGVWATLDILLVDEDLIDDEILTLIGQPGY